VEAIFIAGAGIAFAKAGLWLKGWQEYEKRNADVASDAGGGIHVDDEPEPGDEPDLGDEPELDAEPDLDGEPELDDELALDDEPDFDDEPDLDEEPEPVAAGNEA
jgi:hypothetical protein